MERSHQATLEAKLEHQIRQNESSSGHKKNKISRKAFSFKDYDGTKDARIVLAWVSQLDDYFQDEDFSNKDMVKCASNISREVLHCGGMLLNERGIDLGLGMHFKEHSSVNFYPLITNPRLEGNGI